MKHVLMKMIIIIIILILTISSSPNISLVMKRKDFELPSSIIDNISVMHVVSQFLLDLYTLMNNLINEIILYNNRYFILLIVLY